MHVGTPEFCDIDTQTRLKLIEKSEASFTRLYRALDQCQTRGRGLIFLDLLRLCFRSRVALHGICALCTKLPQSALLTPLIEPSSVSSNLFCLDTLPPLFLWSGSTFLASLTRSTCLLSRAVLDSGRGRPLLTSLNSLRGLKLALYSFLSSTSSRS